MVRYKAVIDAGVCPNLMTRFREEVYAKRKKGEPGNEYPSGAPGPPESDLRVPGIRHKYFRQSPDRRRAIRAAQKKGQKPQERLI